MKLHKHTIPVVLGLLLLSFGSASAEDTTPKPPIQMKVKNAVAYTENNVAGIGDRIVVEVENLNEAIKQDKVNPRDLVLFLDGRALVGVNAVPTEDPTTNKLLFELRRTEGSRQVWRTLFGSPTLQNIKAVPASVGYADKQALPASGVIPIVYLRVYSGWWAALGFILLVLAIGLFVWLARRGYLIHDSNPPQPPPGKLKPYSLGLTQAAIWFFLVIGSFLLILMITGDYNTITDQALILMGIGTGTALGAAMIDASKQDTSNNDLSSLRPEAAKIQAEIDELTKQQTDLKAKVDAGSATADEQAALRAVNVTIDEKQARLKEVNKNIDDAESKLSNPVSQSFGKDLLTDANGITLHRFQIVVWTLVLGFLFIAGVYRDLAMPEFSGTLLALMGISSGTYLGFKIPERQN